MTEPRLQHPSTRSPFVAARVALVVMAAALAFAAGCGGAKSNSTPAAGSEPAASPSTTPSTTPAPAETSASAASATVSGDLGTQVFVKRCVLCHGPEGRGNGIASKGLNPKPRNFHDIAYMKTRTDAQLLEVIHKGKGVMPRWEGQLTEAEMKAVLAHVRELGEKP